MFNAVGAAMESEGVKFEVSAKLASGFRTFVQAKSVNATIDVMIIVFFITRVLDT